MTLSPFPIRRTARLVVLDPQHRILLIRYRAAHIMPPLSAADPTFLYTPGGGIEPGETTAEAARRELDEECGIRGVLIGPVVALREAAAPWFRLQRFTIETYHLVRVADAQLDTSRLAETDDEEIIDVRWWSFDELAASGIALIPPGLVDLARRCASGDIPKEPVRLMAQ